MGGDDYSGYVAAHAVPVRMQPDSTWVAEIRGGDVARNVAKVIKSHTWVGGNGGQYDTQESWTGITATDTASYFRVTLK